jgi:pimeloyl-ACP methyl ester carboxylesterase
MNVNQVNLTRPDNTLLTMADVAASTRVDLVAGTVEVTHAVAPHRQYDIDAHGIRLAVYEWGSVDDPVLLLIHGGLDFARTYDVFAPLLAVAGWRVVSWDQRCHGDSEWASLTNWSADLRDAAAVIDHVAPRENGPVPIVGHSKGGAMSIRLAEAWPNRFTKLVNIDGIPSHSPHPDVVDAMQTRLASGELSGWLDFRHSKGRSTSLPSGQGEGFRSGKSDRKPDTLEGLAQRRGRWNPRLAHEWLCYLVTVGGRQDPDGWRWKIDPMLRPGGFGPWRPEWSLESMAQLSVPLLAVLCEEQEPMGWGTRPKHVTKYLPHEAELVVAQTGHFIHIEQPGWTAQLVLSFLGKP